MQKIQLLLVFLLTIVWLAILPSCEAKLEFPTGKPNTSTPVSIVKSALEYQLRYAKDYSMPLAKNICENYLEFYEQIKNVVTDELKDDFDKNYKRFHQFLTQYDALSESFETVKIQIKETKTISVDSKKEFKQVLNFIYQNLNSIRESYSQMISRDSAEKDIAKLTKLFYVEANKFLKSLGLRNDIFSNNSIKEIDELIFAYPSKLEPVLKSFRIVTANFEKPLINSDSQNVINETKNQEFLAFHSAGKWFLTDFDVSTFEIVDENFSNINFFSNPEADFENKTVEQALNSSVKLFLYQNSRLFTKNSVEASVSRFKDIIKNIKISNAWCSNIENSELIKNYQDSFQFLQQNVGKLIQHNYKIIDKKPISKFEKNYSLELQTTNFKIQENSDVEKPSNFVLVSKTEKLSISLQLQNGKWLIAKINKIYN